MRPCILEARGHPQSFCKKRKEDAPRRFVIDHFITFLSKKGKSNCEIARLLGLSEGTIRYRIKRKRKADLRKQRLSELDRFREVIIEWTCNTDEDSGIKRRPTLKLLYFHLRDGYLYNGSYDSVCHYIKRHFPGVLAANALHPHANPLTTTHEIEPRSGKSSPMATSNVIVRAEFSAMDRTIIASNQPNLWEISENVFTF